MKANRSASILDERVYLHRVSIFFKNIMKNQYLIYYFNFEQNTSSYLVLAIIMIYYITFIELLAGLFCLTESRSLVTRF